MAAPSEPGLFRADEVPDKPHPQCLCFLTAVLMEEQDFMAQLLSGGFDEILGV